MRGCLESPSQHSLLLYAHLVTSFCLGSNDGFCFAFTRSPGSDSLPESNPEPSAKDSGKFNSPSLESKEWIQGYGVKNNEQHNTKLVNRMIIVFCLVHISRQRTIHESFGPSKDTLQRRNYANFAKIDSIF